MEALASLGTTGGSRTEATGYHRAAAVLAHFNPDVLKPVGTAASQSDFQQLLADSTVLKSDDGRLVWSLRLDVRQDVLRSMTPQEMLDLTILAFDLSFRYRNPVVVLADGYLGQMTGKVTLPDTLLRPGLPGWAVYGDRAHRPNLISSIQLSESDLEAHNLRLIEKYALMARSEQRAELYETEDAHALLVACNTPARLAKGAVCELRDRGIRAGLFRPVTLWPFPIDALRPLLRPGLRLVMVEASDGQIEDELRLALSHAGIAPPPIEHVRRYGGVLPRQEEIVARVLGTTERGAA